MESVHNFIEHLVVKFLRLQISQSSKFKVMVGNDDKLQCSSSCTNVPVMLGNKQFFIGFYVLPSSGSVVLAVQWLKTLGLIVIDYAFLSMKFQWM